MAKYCNFKREEIHLDRYAQGGARAIIIGNKHEPKCVATINIPELYLTDDYVLIKNYSENEGVLEDLIEMGVVSKPVDIIPLGHGRGHICKLLIR